MTFSCGHCGQRFDTKSAKRAHKGSCLGHGTNNEAEENHYRPPVLTPAEIAEANRQWDAIPSHPDDIRSWAKRPPISTKREVDALGRAA